MKPEDDAAGYVFLDIEWRHSGLPPRFLGLDPAVVLIVPLALFGLRQGWGWGYMILLCVFLALNVYVALRGYPSLRVFLQSQSVRLIGRCQWNPR